MSAQSIETIELPGLICRIIEGETLVDAYALAAYFAIVDKSPYVETWNIETAN